MPNTTEVNLNLEVCTSDQFSDLVFEFLMIEYNILVLEQFAFRMGKEYANKSVEEFIAYKHFEVWKTFEVTASTQNVYTKRLMERKFREGMASTK